MNDRRISKIARLVQKALGEIFQRQTQTMPGVIVSVTRVAPSPDLSFCKVYLSGGDHHSNPTQCGSSALCAGC